MVYSFPIETVKDVSRASSIEDGDGANRRPAGPSVCNARSSSSSSSSFWGLIKRRQSISPGEMTNDVLWPFFLLLLLLPSNLWDMLLKYLSGLAVGRKWMIIWSAVSAIFDKDQRWELASSSDDRDSFNLVPSRLVSSSIIITTNVSWNDQVRWGNGINYQLWQEISPEIWTRTSKVHRLFHLETAI